MTSTNNYFATHFLTTFCQTLCQSGAFGFSKPTFNLSHVTFRADTKIKSSQGKL